MFGDRLKLARKKAGFSLRGLSEALDGGVSAQAIGKYERGVMMPSSGVLIQLTKSLDVSLDFLLSDQVEALEAVDFRKHSGTSVSERSRVEATVIDHLQRYLAVEEVLGISAETSLSKIEKSEALTDESKAEGLADTIREKWELGTDPIPNMTSLLEDHGLKVLVIPLPERVSGLTCLVHNATNTRISAVIVVNKDHTLERRRLTLAHEFAHRLISESSDIDHEKAANVFAGAFLAPRAHLIEEIGRYRKSFGYEELKQLKRMYRISAVALLMRLRQIEVIDQSTLTHAFRTFARTWRKSEPDPLEDPPEIEGGKHEFPKRFDRLCYRALAEGLISQGKASELLRQPLSIIEAGLKGPVEADADSRQ